MLFPTFRFSIWHPAAADTRLRVARASTSVAAIGFGVAVGLFIGLPATAQDAPHSRAQNLTCTVCHLNHDSFGNQIGSTAGNANLCLSCHQVGGLASSSPLAESQQATLGPVAGGQPQAAGTSHRWDAGPAGRVESLSGAPSSAIEPGGVYTGRYAVSYTITITQTGNSGQARLTGSPAVPARAAERRF